ncbi:NADPH-dependent FMN reductase [Patulibacter defluvii]|uniref:NADPH-dependent FMN reductase n=1 Tax=Patulibacter defluvii TaxID=3095358 RepID=UPI002A754A8E|nr:NAD(P)H-dependent oxidoreductase [Patulibacter sp. DM4]
MPTTESPLQVAVIVGSTRPGRYGVEVARWVAAHAAARDGAAVETVDLADHDLPLLDEPTPALWGRYEHPHTTAWAREIARHDAFVFVTPEYNHSIPGALKNAIDFLYEEWADKAAGFVSYGADAGGARAVEHLRSVLGEVQVADVRSQVALSLIDDVDDGVLRPTPRHVAKLDALLDQLLAWGGALRGLRTAREAEAEANAETGATR